MADASKLNQIAAQYNVAHGAWTPEEVAAFSRGAGGTGDAGSNTSPADSGAQSQPETADPTAGMTDDERDAWANQELAKTMKAQGATGLGQ